MRKLIYILISLIVLLLNIGCVRRSGPSYAVNMSATSDTHRNNPPRNIPTQNIVDGKVKYTGSEIFSMYNSAVFMVYTSDGLNQYQGSGFFVSSSGMAVSNYHVFKGTGVGYEQLKLADGKTCKIKEVIAKNSEHDFIVFIVDIPTTCNYIPIASRQSKVGEKIYTIGSPRGLENTFSSGEISQLREGGVIQISAPIDHGSSGGALINEYGEVIGITSAGIDESGANLNFAVDIRITKSYIR